MAEPRTRRVLTLFLASPGDLKDERALAREVIESVNRIIRPLGWFVDLVVWEDTGPGFVRPQARINRDVDICDLFVGLLWQRWGQPTGTHDSGFFEEYERARDRRVATGAPDIWVVFKKVAPDKLADPGDELKRVLAFRRRLVERKELKFNEFEEPLHWRVLFQEWLVIHVHELDRAAQAVPASAEEAASSSPSSPGEPAVPESDRRRGELPAQLKDALDIARNAGDLSPLQIVRLKLFSSALLVPVERRELLTATDVNLLYHYHRDLEILPRERHLIFRTVITDVADIVPGWFWLDRFEPEDVIAITGFVALRDGNSATRREAIKLMTRLKQRPNGEPPAQFFEAITADDSDEVKVAAFRYLGAVGDLNEVATAEVGTSDVASAVRTAAAEAVYSIGSARPRARLCSHSIRRAKREVICVTSAGGCAARGPPPRSRDKGRARSPPLRSRRIAPSWTTVS
jgi:Domain of unknown function (DUF4062)